MFQRLLLVFILGSLSPWAGLSSEKRDWWAFQPLTRVVPPVMEGVAHPVDRFLLARAKEQRLRFSPPADGRVLVRRASLDLVGLPPAPEQLDRFASDPRPEAWEHLMDELLSSPHYGERWARHWLDVARFAESSGFEHDYDREGAFHYRDFVIKAFNADLSYDQFVRWQLAGDEFEPNNALALSATGFLGAGVFPTQITANEVERTRYDAMDDMLSTTSQAFLGLTVGCARCHDHKYDPISNQDYYRMLSTFTTTVRSVVELDVDGKTKVLICAEGYDPLRMHTQGADFFKETYFLKRGDTALKEGVADQSFLPVLMRESVDRWQNKPSSGVRFSGRRSALARWLTDADTGAGALLARVIVNRLWQHHFGNGLVTTPNDFGHTGAAPTHPALLDWLAAELIRGGWKLKPMHRLIMTSAAYQQACLDDPAQVSADPDNTLWMRRVPRRLEAETIRDCLLAVSGQLDPSLYGPGTREERSRRRSIYFTIKRSQLMGSMVAFDQPEPLVSQGQRPVTTVAPQALLLLNGPQVREWAQAFARRLSADVSDPAQREARVKRAYSLALGRSPDSDEVRDAISFLDSQSRPDGSAVDEQAWIDLCQVIFGLNEFAYEP